MALAVLAGVTAMAVQGAPHPRCFGPAARDPRQPCHNPRLARVAVPSVDTVLLQPTAPCALLRRARPEVCIFGVRRGPIARRVALIGDSHSAHWRAALAEVSRKHAWYSYSLYQTQCPFNRAVALLHGENFRLCAQWKDDVIAWMNAHRSIRTVIVSEHHVPIEPAGGKSSRETEIAGYIAAWNALPPSVSRIIVIRDPAYNAENWQDCVARSLSRHGHPGRDCRQPRAVALHPDVAVLAARRLNSPRVRVVDLTPFFCGRRFCFPVVGGVLTHKDHGHLSLLYSTLLGPYLDRALFPLV